MNRRPPALAAFAAAVLLAGPRPAHAASPREQEALARYDAGDRRCDGPRPRGPRRANASCLDPQGAAQEYRASALAYIAAARDARDDDDAFEKLFGRATDALRAAVKVGSSADDVRAVCDALRSAAYERPAGLAADAGHVRLDALCPAAPPPTPPQPTPISPPASPPDRAVLDRPPPFVVHNVHPRGSPDARPRLGLGLAFASVGVALVSAGAIALAIDRDKLREANGMLGPTADLEASAAYFKRVNDVRSAELGLLAAGAGLLVTIPAATAADLRRASIAAGVMAALGAGVSVAGAIFHVRADRAAERVFDAPASPDEPRDEAFYAGPRRSQTAAAAALGAGAGVLIGSAVALAVRRSLHRRHRRYALTPQLGATGLGLRLTGRF